MSSGRTGLRERGGSTGSESTPAAAPVSVNVTPDALISALQNHQVVEAFSKLLQPILQSLLDETVTNLKSEINSLSDELHNRNARVAELEKTNELLTSRVEALEAYSRIDNVIISGLPESYAEKASSSRRSSAAAANMHTDGETEPVNDDSPRDTFVNQSEKVFLDFCNNLLKVDIQHSDISTCHRLRKPDHAEHLPMIVRFANRNARSLLMKQKKNLREMKLNIYIGEHLTKQTSELFAFARTKVKNKQLAGAWTRNGKLYIKENDTSDIKYIKSHHDLDGY